MTEPDRTDPQVTSETGPTAGDLGALSTESVRSELSDLDLLDPADLVALMLSDARRATVALAAAAAPITSAVELVHRRLGSGGRLIYVGAGTAGRLAVLDAAELGPTFSVPEGTVTALLAGGDEALRHAVEGAEDDGPAGAEALELLALSERDAVIGVSASGRTAYVIGALEHARSKGAGVISISCNEASPLSALADVAIELFVGGEVVAGSSRMNAGTAQKIALNTISTAVMVLLGKTYGNLMVDLRPTNAKLRNRAARIVTAVTGVAPGRAVEALETAGWDTKLASLIATSGKDLAEVSPILEAAQGRLRDALAVVGAESADPARALGATAAVSSPGGDRSRWRRLGVAAAFIGGALVPGDVAVKDGTVVGLGLPGKGSGIAAPGLIDLQVNGYAGIDAARASVDELEAMGMALMGDGVLAYQPTLISDEPALTCAAAGRIAELVARGRGRGARILGVHLEGPFLAPDRAGVHPPGRLRRPDMELAKSLFTAGPVTMFTLAPELPGALELIRWLVDRGCVVSLGHSAATAGVSAAAIAAGASAVTHLYNAMPPVSARDPGLVGVALSDGRVHLQLIADGVHVADELVRLAFLAAPSRCSIVTDATSLAGQGDGQLTLGEVPIEVSGGVARGRDGTIAGGASTLLHGLRRLVSLSIDLPTALAAVTQRPARVIGRGDVGHLREGVEANLVVLDDNLELRDVLVEGRSVAVA